jgi:serine-type D-Ala-D-Ala carboxypeptidase (penicillin-binding protein 5/6)
MKRMAQEMLAGCVIACTALLSGRADAAKVAPRSAEPYLGMIVVDAATGHVLFEDHADAQGYPASVVKLMDLLIILERVEKGQASVTDVVTVTAEASRIGGSQVYLGEHETFPLDDMLYALMVQSANDAATALAIHVSGSKEGFVELMNPRAAALGMTNTQYHSVHGLPPSPGQLPDVSTPRDLAVLARELLKHKDTLRYTGTRERAFRDGKFVMRNHNHLLGNFAGCDGMKTGYFTAGGYSIVATAQKDGQRVIAVVLGSKNRQSRDRAARQLLAKGLAALPPLPAVTNAVVQAGPVTNAATARPVEDEGTGRWGCGRLGIIGLGVAALLVVTVVAFRLGRKVRGGNE